jgi:hypothetical protein
MAYIAVQQIRIRGAHRRGSGQRSLQGRPIGPFRSVCFSAKAGEGVGGTASVPNLSPLRGYS